VIGAISSGAGQIVTNLASGKKWNEGLGTAMLVGGVTGLIPGAGKALGTVGSKIAGKFGSSVANSVVGRMGSKIASSALGKGAAALARGASRFTGKLGELAERGLATKAGRVLSAPFRGAANLGTKLGNATRDGLERKFPNVIKPRTGPELPGGGSPIHEEPTPTSSSPSKGGQVTDDADAVAKDAAKKSADVENPEALRDQIDGVTGVNKGSEYDKAQRELKEFYENQAKEATQTAKDVSTYRTDPRFDPATGAPDVPYGIPGRYEARTFAYEGENLTEVTMKVHLQGQPGVGPDDLARVQRDAYSGIDQYYNNGQRLPNGNRLHVNVEFTDDAAAAHLKVDVHPGGKGPLDRANQNKWYVDSEPTTHAHELGHQMGLYDEYVDPTAVNRYLPNSPGVHTDDSLMGNYWTTDANGNLIPKPGTGVKPRHLDQIGGDIDNAAHMTGPKGPAAPGPQGKPSQMPGKGGAQDTAQAADVDLNDLKPVGSSPSLSMPKDGAHPPPKEIALAEKLSGEQGGRGFVFPKSKNQAGIDGFWADTGQPVQFKTLTGSAKRQPSSIVEHANDAYKKAANNGWENVELHIEAPSTTVEEATKRWAAQNATVTPTDMSGGALESITVHCSDGVVTLPLGKAGP
jgi:hypothetical protein